MPTLTPKTKIAYGLGDFACNFIYQFVLLYLMFYFTDVFGLGAVAAGVVFFIAKIWDALFAPTMGVISDHTHSRHGQKRPYLLYGPIPLVITFFLLLLSPALGTTGKIIYAQLIFILLCTCYSIVNVPYSAMTANLTLDSRERASLTAYRMFCAITGTLIVATATLPIAHLFHNSVIGFRALAIVYGIIIVTALWITFATVKERYLQAKNEKFSFAEIKTILQSNKPFILLFCGVVAHLVACCIFLASTNYYFKYVMHNEALIPIAFFSIYIAAALALPMWLRFSNLCSKKLMFNTGMILLALMAMVLFFAQHLSILATIIIFAFVGVAIATIYLGPWSMVPDTVEYSQWKTGLRREGIIYGMFIFSQLVSPGIAGLLIGIQLHLSGYVANTVASTHTLIGIRIMTCLTPIAFIAAGLILIGMYPINHRFHRKILDELHIT